MKKIQLLCGVLLLVTCFSPISKSEIIKVKNYQVLSPSAVCKDYGAILNELYMQIDNEINRIFERVIAQKENKEREKQIRSFRTQNPGNILYYVKDEELKNIHALCEQALLLYNEYFSNTEKHHFRTLTLCSQFSYFLWVKTQFSRSMSIVVLNPMWYSLFVNQVRSLDFLMDKGKIDKTNVKEWILAYENVLEVGLYLYYYAFSNYNCPENISDSLSLICQRYDELTGVAENFDVVLGKKSFACIQLLRTEDQYQENIVFPVFPPSFISVFDQIMLLVYDKDVEDRIAFIDKNKVRIDESVNLEYDSSTMLFSIYYKFLKLIQEGTKFTESKDFIKSIEILEEAIRLNEDNQYRAQVNYLLMLIVNYIQVKLDVRHPLMVFAERKNISTYCKQAFSSYRGAGGYCAYLQTFLQLDDNIDETSILPPVRFKRFYEEDLKYEQEAFLVAAAGETDKGTSHFYLPDWFADSINNISFNPELGFCNILHAMYILMRENVDFLTLIISPEEDNYFTIKNYARIKRNYMDSELEVLPFLCNWFVKNPMLFDEWIQQFTNMFAQLKLAEDEDKFPHEKYQGITRLFRVIEAIEYELNQEKNYSACLKLYPLYEYMCNLVFSDGFLFEKQKLEICEIIIPCSGIFTEAFYAYGAYEKALEIATCSVELVNLWEEKIQIYESDVRLKGKEERKSIYLKRLKVETLKTRLSLLQTFLQWVTFLKNRDVFIHAKEEFLEQWETTIENIPYSHKHIMKLYELIKDIMEVESNRALLPAINRMKVLGNLLMGKYKGTSVCSIDEVELKDTIGPIRFLERKNKWLYELFARPSQTHETFSILFFPLLYQMVEQRFGYDENSYAELQDLWESFLEDESYGFTFNSSENVLSEENVSARDEYELEYASKLVNILFELANPKIPINSLVNGEVQEVMKKLEKELSVNNLDAISYNGRLLYHISILHEMRLLSSVFEESKMIDIFLLERMTNHLVLFFESYPMSKEQEYYTNAIVFPLYLYLFEAEIFLSKDSYIKGNPNFEIENFYSIIFSMFFNSEIRLTENALHNIAEYLVTRNYFRYHDFNFFPETPIMQAGFMEQIREGLKNKNMQIISRFELFLTLAKEMSFWFDITTKEFFEELLESTKSNEELRTLHELIQNIHSSQVRAFSDKESLLFLVKDCNSAQEWGKTISLYEQNMPKNNKYIRIIEDVKKNLEEYSQRLTRVADLIASEKLTEAVEALNGFPDCFQEFSMVKAFKKDCVYLKKIVACAQNSNTPITRIEEILTLNPKKELKSKCAQKALNTIIEKIKIQYEIVQIYEKEYQKIIHDDVYIRRNLDILIKKWDLQINAFSHPEYFNEFLEQLLERAKQRDALFEEFDEYFKELEISPNNQGIFEKTTGILLCILALDSSHHLMKKKARDLGKKIANTTHAVLFEKYLQKSRIYFEDSSFFLRSLYLILSDWHRNKNNYQKALNVLSNIIDLDELLRDPSKSNSAKKKSANSITTKKKKKKKATTGKKLNREQIIFQASNLALYCNAHIVYEKIKSLYDIVQAFADADAYRQKQFCEVRHGKGIAYKNLYINYESNTIDVSNFPYMQNMQTTIPLHFVVGDTYRLYANGDDEPFECSLEVVEVVQNSANTKSKVRFKISEQFLNGDKLLEDVLKEIRRRYKTGIIERIPNLPWKEQAEFLRAPLGYLESTFANDYFLETGLADIPSFGDDFMDIICGLRYESKEIANKINTSDFSQQSPVMQIYHLFQKFIGEDYDQLRTTKLNIYLKKKVHVIWGPGGAGKSTVIAESALQVIQEGRDVLIVAPTNRAVEEIIAKIIEVEPSIEGKMNLDGLWIRLAARDEKVGAEGARYQQQIKNNWTERKKITETLFSKGKRKRGSIWCGTSTGMSNDELWNRVILPRIRSFSFILLDEASMSSVPETLRLLEFLDKENGVFAIVGDHAQLCVYPLSEELIQQTKKDLVASGTYTSSQLETIFSPESQLLFRDSLLTTLSKRKDLPLTMLKTIRRCPAPITFFHNYILPAYQGKLLSREPSKEDLAFPISIFDYRSKTRYPNESLLNNERGQYVNDFEINLTLEEVDRNLSEGATPEEIMIIAPYKAHLKMLRIALCIKGLLNDIAKERRYYSDLTREEKSLLQSGLQKGVQLDLLVQTKMKPDRIVQVLREKMKWNIYPQFNQDIHYKQLQHLMEVESELHAVQKKEKKDKYLTLTTIQQVQGGEREYVIVNGVRSNKYGEKGFFSEYGGSHLVTVMMTRAKKKLSIICDFRTFCYKKKNRRNRRGVIADAQLRADREVVDIFRRIYLYGVFYGNKNNVNNAGVYYHFIRDGKIPLKLDFVSSDSFLELKQTRMMALSA